MSAQQDLFGAAPADMPRRQTAPGRRRTDWRALGEVGQARTLVRALDADSSFMLRARDFVLDQLRQHGPSSGEDLTDAAKAAGITPPDDRAFGAVFSFLSRKRAIEPAGFCERRKGHGTAGGRIWALGDKHG